MQAGVNVGRFTFWRREETPTVVCVQEGRAPSYEWLRLDDTSGAVRALLDELSLERRETLRLGEQCADLGRRIQVMELGA